MFGTTQKTPQSWDVSISTMASDPAAHSNNSYSKGDQPEGSLGESLISASAPLRWSIHWSMFEDAEWKKSGWWGFRSYVSIAINTTLRLPETSNVIQPPVRKTCGQLGCYVQMTGICAFVCHSKGKKPAHPTSPPQHLLDLSAESPMREGSMRKTFMSLQLSIFWLICWESQSAQFQCSFVVFHGWWLSLPKFLGQATSSSSSLWPFHSKMTWTLCSLCSVHTSHRWQNVMMTQCHAWEITV